MADFTAMVRVGGGTTGDKAQEIPAYDAMYITAADPPGTLLGDAARTHGANAAAGAALAKATVGHLIFDPLLPGIGADLLAIFQ